MNDAPGMAAGPLATREVFLDTQSYREMEFDCAHPSMRALLAYAAKDRVRIHTTDITLREVLRQIMGMSEDLAKDVARTAVAIEKWRRRLPAQTSSGVLPSGLDASQPTKLGNAYFSAFRAALRSARTTEHAASAQDAESVFRAYFERRPPFDDVKKPKEFPDAFVISALGGWCEASDTSMYIVSRDKGMLAAAEAHGRLIPVAALSEFLESVIYDHDPGVEERVSALFGAEIIGTTLSNAFDEHCDSVAFIYHGDLSEGEVISARSSGAAREIDWDVISVTSERFGVVASFIQPILASVDFEDRELAYYDKEDDSYFGAEAASTEIEAEVEAKLFVELDLTGRVIRSELLTNELEFHDPAGPYY